MLPVRGAAVRFAVAVQFTLPVPGPVPAAPADTVIQVESEPKVHAQKYGLGVAVSVPVPPPATTVGIGFGEKAHAHCCAPSGAASRAASAANSSKALIHTIVTPGGRLREYSPRPAYRHARRWSRPRPLEQAERPAPPPRPGRQSGHREAGASAASHRLRSAGGRAPPPPRSIPCRATPRAWTSRPARTAWGRRFRPPIRHAPAGSIATPPRQSPAPPHACAPPRCTARRAV